MRCARSGCARTGRCARSRLRPGFRSATSPRSNGARRRRPQSCWPPSAPLWAFAWLTCFATSATPSARWSRSPCRKPCPTPCRHSSRWARTRRWSSPTVARPVPPYRWSVSMPTGPLSPPESGSPAAPAARPPGELPGSQRCPRGPRSGADVGREVLAGEGGAGGDEVGGCALEDDPAAVVAGAGAEVDDPVGVRQDRLVVRDDDDRLAGVDEPVEQAEQVLDVGEVEAGGRLVEDVDEALLGHVGGQLEPLPLAAGQRSERLAEDEVAEPDVGEPVEDGVRGRRARLAGAEELLGLGQ